MNKHIITIIVALMAFGIGAKAQTVYSCQYKSEADVKVHVTKYKSETDLVVYKCKYKSEAEDNKGLWFFVKYKSEAKKKLFFVNYKSEADIVIYFTDYKSEAGWRNNSKKTSDVLTFRKYDLSLIAALVAAVGVSAQSHIRHWRAAAPNIRATQ